MIAIIAAVVIIGGFMLFNNGGSDTVNEPVAKTVTDYPIMANDGSIIYKWTGELTEQNLPTGNGVASFASGDKQSRKEYRGEMKDGQFESSKATLLYTNGSIFDGSFMNGKRNSGTLTLKEDEMYYTGTFKDDKEYNGKWYFLGSNELYSEIVNGKEIIK